MFAEIIGQGPVRLVRLAAEDIGIKKLKIDFLLLLGRQLRVVRVGLLLERLSPARRRYAELFSLGGAALFTGYMAWSVTRFVYQSYAINDIAQGMLPIPMWIPQSSFAVGVIVLFIAFVDELVIVIRKGTPTYVLAEEERHARGEFGESV